MKEPFKFIKSEFDNSLVVHIAKSLDRTKCTLKDVVDKNGKHTKRWVTNGVQVNTDHQKNLNFSVGFRTVEPRLAEIMDDAVIESINKTYSNLEKQYKVIEKLDEVSLLVNKNKLNPPIHSLSINDNKAIISYREDFYSQSSDEIKKIIDEDIKNKTRINVDEEQKCSYDTIQQYGQLILNKLFADSKEENKTVFLSKMFKNVMTKMAENKLSITDGSISKFTTMYQNDKNNREKFFTHFFLDGFVGATKNKPTNLGRAIHVYIRENLK